MALQAEGKSLRRIAAELAVQRQAAGEPSRQSSASIAAWRPAGTKANKDSLKARILVGIGADETGADWQMHLYGNTVHIVGKGNKERLLPS